jgi:hypothetical protein
MLVYREEIGNRPALGMTPLLTYFFTGNWKHKYQLMYILTLNLSNDGVLKQA